MKRWQWLGLSVMFFLVLVSFIILFLVQEKFMATDKYFERKTAIVPELRITLNGVTLNEIKENGKDTRYLGNRLKIYDLEFANVEIKGRGNATWAHEKKPYQLKLPTKVDLLNLGKQRKWILLANYWDDTNLRTDIAFYLAKMVGEEFANSGEFVEFYINDNYEGLYYLTQGIGVGKNGIRLRNPLGILVELDNMYGRIEDLFYYSSNGECLTIKDVVVKDNSEIAMDDFMQSFDALEIAIKNQDYNKIAEVIDIESFAQYYLISEFTANSDAYFTSHYFYKDGPDDKIHAGPVWDFDIAFNNTRTRDEFMADWDMTKNINKEYFENPDQQYYQWSRLFARLIDFSEFRVEVNRIFRERMLGKKYELISYISKRAEEIYESAQRENERWGKDDYAQSVKKLLDWINKRYDYFEKEYGKIYGNNI